MRALLSVLLAGLCSSVVNGKTAKSSLEGRVITLTELNFDELVGNGKESWMIAISVPWCPACQEMEPHWAALAEELHEDGIKVAKIDGTKERGLLSRFSVQHFPSIYHIRGSETREYEGQRTTDAMAVFARGGWTQVEPRRGCSSPVSTCGRMLGEATKLPARFKTLYFHLHDDKGWGELPLFAGMLAIPLSIGLTFICLLDAYYTRRPLPPAVLHPHTD